MTVDIYCDGSGTTWDKCAGYGWLILVDGRFHSEGHGHLANGTNNDAEVAAAMNGLMRAQALLAKQKSDHQFFNGNIFDWRHPKVRVNSDSQLCLGWITGRYRYSKDTPQTIERIRIAKSLMASCRAEPVWVQGHSGDLWNDRADALAHFGRVGKWKRKRDAAWAPPQG